jgi:hypothetical protein
VSATATDTGFNPGMASGDTLTLVFDQAVYTGLNVTDARTLVSLSPPLPALATLAGTWASNRTLVLVLGLPQDWRRTVSSLLPWAVGALTVSTSPGANLQSYNRESAASNSTATVGQGTWGDVPSATITEQSSSSVAVALWPPPPPLRFTVDVYVLQWSSDPAFGDVARLAVVAPVLAAVAGAGLPPHAMALSLVDGDPVGPVTLLNITGNGQSPSGTAVLVASAQGGALATPPFGFVLAGLASGLQLHFRVACVNPGGALSSPVATSPAWVRLQPPILLAVSVAGTTLRTGGGNPVVVTGIQVGASTSVVTMRLLGPRGTLTSGPCTILTPTVVVQCSSPVGVGVGYAVYLVVDSVVSEPWPNRTLSFSPPVVLGLVEAGGGPVRTLSTNGDGLQVRLILYKGGAVVMVVGCIGWWCGWCVVVCGGLWSWFRFSTVTLPAYLSFVWVACFHILAFAACSHAHLGGIHVAGDVMFWCFRCVHCFPGTQVVLTGSNFGTVRQGVTGDLGRVTYVWKAQSSWGCLGGEGKEGRG